MNWRQNCFASPCPIFFFSLTAFAGAILNVYGEFALSALTPVWLNIAMIAAAIELASRLSQPVTALAWGVFAAGIVQLAFQLPAKLRSATVFMR
ncbi:lipid II flippase MurJ [Methylomicrobium sp. RS1]|uniref:lipid II flippase MurJ n=1 Tax=Candidatus Methylomicrobium oryzae TaxID=2802053 RepID=UPI002351899B|nr:lipid II flippase MurJ [Methylomicrobium sp. RS1]